MVKKKIEAWLKGIKKAVVEEEQFPCRSSRSFFQKKYYRFNIFYGKEHPELSSGRFRTSEAAQRGLDAYLQGNCDLMFGDVNKKGE